MSETCQKREQKIKVRGKVITRVGKTDSTIFPIWTYKAGGRTYFIVKSSLASGKDKKINTKFEMWCLKLKLSKPLKGDNELELRVSKLV